MAKVVDVVYDANLVTHEELLTIPRVGDMVAKMILQRRKELGTLSSLDDIRKLPGMGAGKLEVLAKYLSFSGDGVTASVTEAEEVKEEILASLEDDEESSEPEEEVSTETKVETKTESAEDDLNVDDLLGDL